MNSAGVSGRNPYPGSEAAKSYRTRKEYEYHTTADWSGNVGDEGEAPEKFKKWLLRVRGY